MTAGSKTEDHAIRTESARQSFRSGFRSTGSWIRGLLGFFRWFCRWVEVLRLCGFPFFLEVWGRTRNFRHGCAIFTVPSSCDTVSHLSVESRRSFCSSSFGFSWSKDGHFSGKVSSSCILFSCLLCCCKTRSLFLSRLLSNFNSWWRFYWRWCWYCLLFCFWSLFSCLPRPIDSYRFD